MADTYRATLLNALIKDKLGRAMKSNPEAFGTPTNPIPIPGVIGSTIDDSNYNSPINIGGDVSQFAQNVQMSRPTGADSIQALTSQNPPKPGMDAGTQATKGWGEAMLNGLQSLGLWDRSSSMFSSSIPGPAASNPSPSSNTDQPKGPPDKAAEHAAKLADTKASAAEAAKTIQAGGQPTDQGGNDLMVLLGLNHAAAAGADTSDPSVYDQIQQHANQMMAEVAPEKKIDLLAAGLGILQGMGDRSAPFASVIGAGLSKGVESATADRQRDVMNKIASVKTATDMAQVAAQYDTNKMARNTAAANSVETVRHDLNTESTDRIKAAAAMIAAQRPTAGANAADKQLYDNLHSMASTYGNQLGVQFQGNPGKEGSTPGQDFADSVSLYAQAALKTGQAKTPGEAIRLGAAMYQQDTGVKFAKDGNIFSPDTVQAKTNGATGMFMTTLNNIFNTKAQPRQ